MTKAARSVPALITAVAAVLALTLYIIPMSSAKPRAAALPSSGTKNVTGSLVISDDCVLPKGAVLYVKKGGKLYIKENAEFTLNGTLKNSLRRLSFRQGKADLRERLEDLRHRTA